MPSKAPRKKQPRTDDAGAELWLTPIVPMGKFAGIDSLAAKTVPAISARLKTEGCSCLLKNDIFQEPLSELIPPILGCKLIHLRAPSYSATNGTRTELTDEEKAKCRKKIREIVSESPLLQCVEVVIVREDDATIKVDWSKETGKWKIVWWFELVPRKPKFCHADLEGIGGTFPKENQPH